MRAMLLWTINDFPAYANLSVWSTKGDLACPNCHLDTQSHYLKHGHKYFYMEHRRWLPEDHKWRLNKRSFGGKVQRSPPPNHLTGHDVMEQLTGYSNVEFGKEVNGKRKRGTILDLTGKNKDSLNARLDLADMKMHDKLRAKSLGNNKWAMRTFKSFVRNKAHPEASIANGYIEMECLTFCSRYMSKIETIFNRPDRNKDISHSQPYNLSIFSRMGKPLGKTSLRQMTVEKRREAQLYALFNCDEARPFLTEYENEPISQKIDLCKWFENRWLTINDIYIKKLWKEEDPRVIEELLCLARGPMKKVVPFDGYVINGFRFHTRKRQRNRKTQNSGVVVKGDEESGQKDFYGILEEVVVLEYDALKNRSSPKIVLFKYKWFDVFDERGIKKCNLGAVLINVHRRLKTNESFALASQIEQVFYVACHNEPQWRFVIKANPRNFFDFPIDEDSQEMEPLWEHAQSHVPNYEDKQDGDIPLVRNDVEFEVVDAHIVDDNRMNEIDGEHEENEDDEESEDEFFDTESILQDFDNDLDDEGYESDNSTDSPTSE
ncbi:uncharacterized protein [Spinacia oleracea]|uniref:DUF4218 domain-containing protein n=1 Tax=Spinacia oleracea TaxID=3562 RepID=A0ABM3QXV3_SPIOL|nr:uncharacterized protein LOC130463171 [Spinacia oleracea]